ncbi:hypothetical protein VTG60DRAFT_3277 [Thermothelomyces hinnuleus]
MDHAPSNPDHMANAALGQGVGYGIVLGLGGAFALGMILVTYILKRYNREVQTSEMFNTAGRTVKSGLVASAVVSSWTWAATLLQSTGVCYRYGVSGPFWYASGATVQILLFATLAIELKRRAPNAHTYLEIIKARYGTFAHIVFLVFGLVTNILVSLMLIVGGSATVNALTGMHTIAAIYLLPVGVVAYTLVGGLKATILTDWAHTFILLLIIIVFALTAYSSHDVLGSPSAVYDLLVQAAARHPVEGNKDGSYLTMRSREGATFFVINIVGNFGTVFLDNGYYNKAIAASPVHALPGYLIGGLSWFAIPWLTATTMGLTALAMENTPWFPTYPNRMADADVSAGLVLPYAAVALLGKGGAVATLLIVFMAVTSATSSQLIAVSTICTYDLYRTYFNPVASGRRLIYMSHAVVVGYGVFIATFSVGLWYAGISMGYLYLMMGVIISSAKECGNLGVECTGSNNPMLAGNVAALLSPIVLVAIFTLIFGIDKYNWKSMLEIRRADDHELADGAGVDPEEVPGGHVETPAEQEEERKKLERAGKISKTATVIMTLAFLVLWPMPMYGSGYIFSKRFFTGWVTVGIIWIFCSFIGVGLFPVFESRKTLARTVRSIYLDITGKSHPKTIHAQVMEGQNTPGDATPTEKSMAKEAVQPS